jgi:hypothetical protein
MNNIDFGGRESYNQGKYKGKGGEHGARRARELNASVTDRSR